MSNKIIVHCRHCVFHECGDGGYGSGCNMGNDDTFINKHCIHDNPNKSMECKDFRTVEQMRALLDKSCQEK